MCIHLNFAERPACSGLLGAGRPQKQTIKQCIKFEVHRLRWQHFFFFFFFPTPNEKFEVENDSMYCAVFFFSPYHKRFHSPSSEATAGNSFLCSRCFLAFQELWKQNSVMFFSCNLKGNSCVFKPRPYGYTFWCVNDLCLQ